MTLAECIVRTIFDVDEQSQSKVEGTINKVAGFAKKALGVIGIGFSIKGISELAEAAAGVEALASQFTQTFGEMEEDATNTLNKIADDTGITVNRMKGSFVQIAAFAKTTGMDEAESLEIADRAMQAVADSAAFYDREIEQVTQTMQSFLKGNYANDAALGLSCTETTRNAAANTLYAKSFNELSEAEKQLTLLYMVENANALSGALGQAARESDTWTNQLGNLKQGLTDLKASAGAFVVKPMTDAVKALSEVLRIATRWVQSLNSENNALARGYEKVSTTVKNVVNRFGGLENVMKIALALAAAIVIAMNWSKIVSSVKNVTGVLSLMQKGLGAIKIQTIALIAVIALVLLAIEDFYHFMKGDDSVIGAIFEKAGIDADAARQTIINAFNAVKAFLGTVLGNIRNLVVDVFGKIRSFLSDHSDQIRTMFSSVWAAITQIVSAATRLIQAVISVYAAVVKGVLSVLAGYWERNGDDIMNILGKLADFMGTAFEMIISIITQAADMVTALFSGDFSTAFQLLISVVQTANDLIASLFSALWSAVASLAKIGLNEFYNLIVAGMTKAADWLKSLREQARQWGADFIDGLKAGIEEKITGVIDSVKGFASSIASLIHFSRPDEGPLRDYESWMPDFMTGLAEGIRNGKSTVVNAAKQMAAEVADGAKVEYPDDEPETDKPTGPRLIGRAVGTAKAYAPDVVSGLQKAVTGISAIAQKAVASPQSAYSSVSTSNRSIVQNINISNSYSGDRDIQRTASKAMNKSAGDATAQLANALKYT